MDRRNLGHETLAPLAGERFALILNTSAAIGGQTVETASGNTPSGKDPTLFGGQGAEHGPAGAWGVGQGRAAPMGWPKGTSGAYRATSVTGGGMVSRCCAWPPSEICC